MVHKIIFIFCMFAIILIVGAMDKGTINGWTCLMLGLVNYIVMAISGIKAGFVTKGGQKMNIKKELFLKDKAVHCGSIEKATTFLNECDRAGFKWEFKGERATKHTFFSKYTYDTCYTLRTGTLQYGDKQYFAAKGWEVIEYEIEKEH